MKAAEITKGRSYVNRSGRAERHVLDIGTHFRPPWYGHEQSEPLGEAAVRFIDTRLGKTFYGPNSGKTPTEVYLSAFAAWAAKAVPDADAAPHS